MGLLCGERLADGFQSLVDSLALGNDGLEIIALLFVGNPDGCELMMYVI